MSIEGPFSGAPRNDLFTPANNDLEGQFTLGGGARKIGQTGWSPGTSDGLIGPGPTYGPLQGTSSADAMTQRYQEMGANANDRAAPGIATAGADRYSGMGDASRAQGIQARGMADSSRAMGMGARYDQNDAMGLMRGAAMGQAPSQAQMMMQQGNNQAMANQMSMAAGARGPAAMAMAQQQALGNQANMATNNMNSMGALRAQEMAQARGQYMGATNDIRGADMQQRGQDMSQQGMDMQQRSQDLQAQGMSFAQAQAQANMEMQQRQLNQQAQMGYEGMGLNASEAQLNASQALANYGLNKSQGDRSADFAQQQADRQQFWKVAGAFAGGGSGLMSGGSMGTG